MGKELFCDGWLWSLLQSPWENLSASIFCWYPLNTSWFIDLQTSHTLESHLKPQSPISCKHRGYILYIYNSVVCTGLCRTCKVKCGPFLLVHARTIMPRKDETDPKICFLMSQLCKSGLVPSPWCTRFLFVWEGFFRIIIVIFFCVHLCEV